MEEEFESRIPLNHFYRAFCVYIRKPHVVNSKLRYTTNLLFLKLDRDKWDAGEKDELVKVLRVTAESTNADRGSFTESLSRQGQIFEEKDLDDLNSFDESDKDLYLSIDRNFPKSNKFKSCYVATFIDTLASSASFYCLPESDLSFRQPDYEFVFFAEDRKMILNIKNERQSDQSPKKARLSELNKDNLVENHDGLKSLSSAVEKNCSNWLRFILCKKIRSWILGCSKDESHSTIETHSLIDQSRYDSLYTSLKSLYGAELEASWTENTDPKKFIYEDIAIATYLMVLWELERKETGSPKKQTFVDLGCGNGLLVYLLTQEGHQGYGVDLRRRKIWDKFPITTDLRETTIVPSDENTYPTIDWIIGNHSDELSPWIPVMAARSSYKTRYFLLPCCAYNFNGSKFQRQGKKSQYLSFIDYLLTISEKCGFASTKLDRLKIPSTKRICLVGTGRNFEPEDFFTQCDNIQNFINSSGFSGSEGTSQNWSETFKPRDKVEVVRNCSKVDKGLCEAIIKKIFDRLLEKENFVFDGWNCGGEMKIPEAVDLISADDLKLLKAECGGLQTLLKNKHQVFHIYGGSIRIRTPKKLSERVFQEKSLKRNVVKSCPCYFYSNHPQSCPLNDVDCSYAHK